LIDIATAKVIRTFLIVETLDFLSFCPLPSALCPGALCLLPSAIKLKLASFIFSFLDYFWRAFSSILFICRILGNPITTPFPLKEYPFFYEPLQDTPGKEEIGNLGAGRE
jgi:hypothetical protein